MVNGSGKIFTHLNIARGMKIVHVAMEFKGVTTPKYNLSKSIFGLAQYQAKHGATVKVYVPASRDIQKENLETVENSEMELTVYAQEERKVKIVEVLPKENRDDYSNIQIFLIENNVLFGSFDLYMREKENARPWVVFPLAVLEHLRLIKFCPDILSCNEWQTGLLPIYLRAHSNIQGDPFYGKIRSVFMSHDSTNLGLIPAEQWRLLGLPGDLAAHKSLEHSGQLSLLKAGMNADLILFNSEDDLADAMKRSELEIWGFISEMKNSGKVISILPIAENIYESLPSSYGRGVTEIYRQLLQGGKYSLDLYLTMMKEIENGNYRMEGIFRNIKNWELGRAEVLKQYEARNILSPVYLSAVTNEIISEEPGTRTSSGSAIIGILNDKLATMGKSDKCVLPLDAGENTKTWGIGLAAGRIKGLIRILGKQIGEQVLNQSVSFFAQLPKNGLGWMLPFASDNIVFTERIMVGNRPLNETKYGLVLFAQPENMDRDINLPEMRKLEQFGILTVNEETGELDSFLEKPKIEVIISKIKNINSNWCYKNTFIMAIRRDIAELMVNRYSEQSKANDGKTILEKGIDWSRHIIEPMCMSLADWKKGATEGGRGWGANKQDSKVSKEDWELLWEIAQDIKDASGGIGVGNLGVNSWWADTNNAYEIHYANYLATSYVEAINRNIRELFGVPLDADVQNSLADNVTLPQSKHNYLIMNSIFKKGGKVGKNCVIIDSVFEEEIEIPDQTVIIGSHIYQVDNKESVTECGSLIYNLDTEGAAFKFHKMMAQMSIYLKDGRKVNGIHPVDIEPFKDVFKGKVELQDIGSEKMKLEKKFIFDGRSFDELQDSVSLENTLKAQEKLQLEIKRLRRQI